MQQLARTQGDGLDAADQVRQRGILEQVLQKLSVRGGNELHAALGNGAARERLRLCSNLVHYDDLWHVVLDGLHLQPAQVRPSRGDVVGAGGGWEGRCASRAAHPAPQEISSLLCTVTSKQPSP